MNSSPGDLWSEKIDPPMSETKKQKNQSANLLGEDSMDDNFMVSTREHKIVQPPSYESIYGNVQTVNLNPINTFQFSNTNPVNTFNNAEAKHIVRFSLIILILRK